MKLLVLCLAFSSPLIHAPAQAKIQPKRGVTQVPPAAPVAAAATVGAAPIPAAPMVPPPPGPPPDFIDDETEFDDGDDLPDSYPPPVAGHPGAMPGQIPQIPPGQPFPGQGQMVPPPPPQNTPPPPPQPTTYRNDRPRLTGSKLHFKVLDKIAVKGEPRERGKMEQQ